MKVRCWGCGFIWWKKPRPPVEEHNPHHSEYQREFKAREDVCLPCQKRGKIESEEDEE